MARRKRALGFDTWFLTGTDEHGQKIERSAKQAGHRPQRIHRHSFQPIPGLWDRMGLSYDDYIRTTEERHRKGVQKLFTLLKERGFIYKGSIPASTASPMSYMSTLRRARPARIAGGSRKRSAKRTISSSSPPSNANCWSSTNANPDFIRPEASRNEVISFVRSGLKDLSVSRTSFDWGIPVPGDEKHVIYVWMDALANYITALGLRQRCS